MPAAGHGAEILIGCTLNRTEWNGSEPKRTHRNPASALRCPRPFSSKMSSAISARAQSAAERTSTQRSYRNVGEQCRASGNMHNIRTGRLREIGFLLTLFHKYPGTRIAITMAHSAPSPSLSSPLVGQCWSHTHTHTHRFVQ